MTRTRSAFIAASAKRAQARPPQGIIATNRPPRLAGLALILLPAIAAAGQPADTPVPGVAPAVAQPIPGVGAAAEQPVAGVAPPSSPAERRLTPQQVDAVLAASARRNREIPVGTTTLASEGPCPRIVHGEMGVEAGTGGYGATYGSAVIPIGCHAAGAIAVEVGTGGNQWRGGRR